MLRRASLIALFCLCCNAAFAAVPRSIHATYEIYRSGIRIAMVDEEFSRDKYYYKLASNTTPVGLFSIFSKEKSSIRSEGIVGLEGLRPVTFVSEKEKDQADGRAVLDWSNRKITMYGNGTGKQVILDLVDGTQDRLSAMYQFMFLPLQGRTLEFMMTNGKRLELHQYGIAPKQRLKTALGDIDATYLYFRNQAGELRTEMWLSNQHHNLPYKIIVTDDDGDQLTQVLSKIEIKEW